MHLGESLGLGRRGGGGFSSTTGSFTLSSNRGGNSEAKLRDELGDTQAGHGAARLTNDLKKLDALVAAKQEGGGGGGDKAIVASKDGTIYQREATGVVCAGDTKGTQSIEVCMEAAAAAKHAFFSFDNKANMCTTANSCNVRTAEMTGQIFKRWLGAYNATHATPMAKLAPCAKFDCSSCAPDKSLAITDLQKKVGLCRDYAPRADIICVGLSKTKTQSGIQDPSKLCTKTVMADNLINTALLSGDDAVAAFAKVHGLANHKGQPQALAQCKIRKETICDNGACDVRKQVTCHNVCKLQAWGPPRTVDTTQCDATICDGPFGSIACSEAAMMA